MKIHFFLVDKKTGFCDNVEKIEDVKDKNQVLLVQGLDSGFNLDIGVKNAEGDWIYSGYYLISKYFNSEEKPELSIIVGKYTVLSITRVVPNFEFDFEIRDNKSNIISKKTYNSYSQGLSELAKED